VLPASTGGVPGRRWARRLAAHWGAVGRRGAVAVDGDRVGTMIADDGALALHHGEGESEVRWGSDCRENGSVSGSPSG
jgi:hypothetical protein